MATTPSSSDKAEPAVRSFRVGDIDVAVAIHGRGTGSPRWMFPDVPAAELTAAVAPYVDAEGSIEFVYSSLVLSSDDHVVLLDAGPAPVTGSGPSSITTALHDAGFSRHDVAVVVVSHGHDDHVGGLTDGDATGQALAFPNATHYVAAAELHHWTRGPCRARMASEKLTAVQRAGALALVEGPREVVPGVRVLPAPGHTPGHLAVDVRSRQDRVLYVGDALAHQVNVPHPEWNHFSDLLPDPARRSRRDLVARAAAGRHLVLASHIPVAGRIHRTRAGRWQLTPVDASASETREVESETPLTRSIGGR